MTVTVDTFTEEIRTGTDSPHTFSHAGASSGVRGVLLALIHGGSSTDYITAASYGGVAMTRKQRNTDTATEAGAAEWWFLGAGVPQGTQTVSYTCGSTTDDILACCITLLGTGDTAVIDVDGLNEDQTNPSRTMNYGGRSAMSFAAFYSGLTATTSITAGTNCTKVGTAELSGNFTSAVIRQTTAGTSDFTIAATAASDDTAFACVSVADGDRTANATVATLTFTKYNPTVAVSRNANATVAALTFTSYNVARAGTLEPAVAPIAAFIQQADRGRRAPFSLILTPHPFPPPAASGDLSVNATLAAFSFATYNPTVTKGADLTVAATVAAFTFAKYNAAVNEARNAAATLTAFTFTPRAPTVDKGRNAIATSASFTFTPRAVSLDEARNVVATTTSFTFTPRATSINAARNALATTTAFTFTPRAVSLNEARNVIATSASFTFAPLNPTVTEDNDLRVHPTVAAFTFTPRAASIAKPLNLPAGVASFTFTAHATSIAKPYNANATVATFTFATHAATIPLSSIDIHIDGHEAPDVATITLESEGIAPPVVQPPGVGYRVHLPPRRIPNDIVIRATEAPDVCRILIETDWAAYDEMFLLLVMEAAA